MYLFYFQVFSSTNNKSIKTNIKKAFITTQKPSLQFISIGNLCKKISYKNFF